MKPPVTLTGESFEKNMTRTQRWLQGRRMFNSVQISKFRSICQHHHTIVRSAKETLIDSGDMHTRLYHSQIVQFVQTVGMADRENFKRKRSGEPSVPLTAVAAPALKNEEHRKAPSSSRKVARLPKHEDDSDREMDVSDKKVLDTAAIAAYNEGEAHKGIVRIRAGHCHEFRRLCRISHCVA
jgi:hypothetical protein